MKRIYRHAEQEITVKIGNIPGIGEVEGHTDVFLPRKNTVVDWKSSDVKKIEGYKKTGGSGIYTQGLLAQEREEMEMLKSLDRSGSLPESKVARLIDLMARTKQHSGGVPIEYMGQTMLYLHGLRRMGRKADYAALVFIPRDSNYIEDIWVASCAYRQDVAEGVIKRASYLAGLVREGKLGDLTPHPQCFTCVIKPTLRR